MTRSDARRPAGIGKCRYLAEKLFQNPLLRSFVRSKRIRHRGLSAVQPQAMIEVGRSSLHEEVGRDTERQAMAALRRRRCAIKPRVAAQRLPWVHVPLRREPRQGFRQILAAGASDRTTGYLRPPFGGTPSEFLSQVDRLPQGSRWRGNPWALWHNAFGVLREFARLNKNQTVSNTENTEEFVESANLALGSALSTRRKQVLSVPSVFSVAKKQF
jgi:hypothetical protein